MKENIFLQNIFWENKLISYFFLVFGNKKKQSYINNIYI